MTCAQLVRSIDRQFSCARVIFCSFLDHVDVPEVMAMIQLNRDGTISYDEWIRLFKYMSYYISKVLMDLYDEDLSQTIRHNGEHGTLLHEGLTFRQKIGLQLTLDERIRIRHTFYRDSDKRSPAGELDIHELTEWTAKTWDYFAQYLNDYCR